MARRAGNRGTPRSSAMVADNQFFVESILSERTNADGVSEYHVKWLGYPVRAATWEIAEDIDPDVVAEWKEDQSSQGSVEEQANNEDAEMEEEDANGSVEEQANDEVKGDEMEEEEANGSIDPASHANNHNSQQRRANCPPASTHLVSADQTLGGEGVDRIIGQDANRYLMSYLPDLVTGEERVVWLSRNLVDHARLSAWNALVQSLELALDNVLVRPGDESSLGARFLRQNDYFRNEEGIFIQPLFGPGRRGLQANLIIAGVMDPASEPHDHSLPDESESEETTDDGDQMNFYHEEIDQDDAGEQASVSSRSQPCVAGAINPSSTDNDRIEREGHMAAPTTGIVGQNSASTEEDVDWRMWLESSMFD